MKYGEIMEIKMALTKLGEKDLPIAFEIAKNIRTCNKILTEVQELVQEIFKKYADKDVAGNFIETEGKTQISDNSKLMEYQNELKKLDAEEHSVQFVTISKDVFTNQSISGNLLVPLIGIIITE